MHSAFVGYIKNKHKNDVRDISAMPTTKMKQRGLNSHVHQQHHYHAHRGTCCTLCANWFPSAHSEKTCIEQRMEVIFIHMYKDWNMRVSTGAREPGHQHESLDWSVAAWKGVLV